MRTYKSFFVRHGEVKINIVSKLVEIDISGSVRGECRKYLGEQMRQFGRNICN